MPSSYDTVDLLNPRVGSYLALTFLARVREIVHIETGLPPCSEVMYDIHRDSSKRVSRLSISFPGGHRLRHEFSDQLMADLPVADQMVLLERTVRQLAHDWAAYLA